MRGQGVIKPLTVYSEIIRLMWAKITQGEAHMNTRQFNLSGFNRIAVRFAMELEITQSDTFSIRASGSETFLDNVNIYAEGDKLVVGYRLNILSFLSAPFLHSSVRITLPELRELDIAMAAHGRISGFKSSGDLMVNLAGASKIDLIDISVGDLKWDLSGASHIDGNIETSGNTEIKIAGASHMQLHGKTKDLKINAAGASHLDLKDFQAENASIRLTGASCSLVKLNGKLDIDLEGASNMEYSGQVIMGDVKVNGASNLKKG